MGILLYQIGIFIIIQISSLFSKTSRNTAIILISIFTILQVYTSGLMIIQFLTILISYWFSNSFIFDDKKKDIEVFSEDNSLKKTKTENIDVQIEKQQKEIDKYENSTLNDVYEDLVDNFSNKKFYAAKKLIDVFNIKQITGQATSNKIILFDVYTKILILNHLAGKNEEIKVNLSSFLYNLVYNADEYFQLSKGLEMLLNNQIETDIDPLLFGDLRWKELKVFTKNLSVILGETILFDNDIEKTEKKFLNNNLSPEIYENLRISELNTM